MISNAPFESKQAYRFSVAPMLDCTDRHFRVMMRQISQKALLYTEMVVAQALHHSKQRNQLLDFYSIEHPISLQIGGDNPTLLAEAARMGEDWGYDEINFNVGCPSPRVTSGNFGACLMATPDQVARCIEAMTKASNLPVTIKHRIGIDNLDSDELLVEFVDKIANAGAKRFAIHARKAWLEGLSPKENRTIPPLEHEKVARLKLKRPNLKIELNGNLQSPKDCLNALQLFDGAMVGRAVYEHPMRWTTIDEIIFGEGSKEIKASTIIKQLIPHTENHLRNNGRLWDIAKHFLNLVEEIPGARSWRRNLGEKAHKKNAELKVIEDAAKQLEDAGF